jgi:hypothetical protein
MAENVKGSMIPKRFVSKNRRLKWTYFLTEKDGRATAALRQYFAENPNGEFSGAILKVLPHYVKIDSVENLDTKWLANNGAGAWTIWSFGPRKNEDDPEEKHGDFVAFEKAEDAILFKLRFG